MRGRPKRDCPDDFGVQCQAMGIRALTAHYQAGNETVIRWIGEQPPAVRASLRIVVAERCSTRTNFAPGRQGWISNAERDALVAMMGEAG